MNEAENRAYYRSMLDAIAEQEVEFPANTFSGKGIVLCGGGNYFTCTWVCINLLRYLGCTLPIELWYRGPSEMNVNMINWLGPLNVKCIDAYTHAGKYGRHRLNGWELKAYAIVHSAFEEVLYLDVDNMPVKDPSFLFDSSPYHDFGAVFWPDRYFGRGTGIQWLKPAAWSVCGIEYRDEPEFEAGQLLVNKRTCWKPLLLTLHLNEHSSFYYQWFYGDKDTFHISWHKAEQPYAIVPFRPGEMENGCGIFQHYFDGKILFQHRNRAKWKVFERPVHINGFQHEALCVSFIEKLQSLWSGVVRNLPFEFTPPEKAVYENIVKIRTFRYFLEGYGMRLLELKPDFSIGQGRGEMETGWMVEQDGTDKIVLVITNDGGPTCYLYLSSDNCWQGRWLSYDRMAVQLSSFEQNSP